ncbi:MAG: glycosyltransferase family 2 protein [Polyangiales bacterium]
MQGVFVILMERSRARVVAVVPALDEAPRIARTIATIPTIVDAIVLIDDGSRDDTTARAQAVGDARLRVVRHARRRGVGAAISAGYSIARALGAECAVVLAGDGQMDPRDLERVVAPVLRGEADYVKGNRFAHSDRARAMPVERRIGGMIFSAMTRVATGLDVDDTQCGFTAIGALALDTIDWSRAWTGYGYPNAVLVALARAGLVVREVPVRAIYGDEQSKLHLRHLPPIVAMLAKASIDRVARRSRTAPPRSAHAGTTAGSREAP